MLYIVIAAGTGFILGMLSVYIWNRTHAVGILKFIDHEEMVSVFLELEQDLPVVRKKNRVTVRVENSSFNENH